MRISPDLSNQPTTAIDGAKQAKLVDAAQQFEATMLQELLKPMQHGQSSWGSNEESDLGCIALGTPPPRRLPLCTASRNARPLRVRA